MSTVPASEFRIGIMMKCGCAAPGTLSQLRILSLLSETELDDYNLEDLFDRLQGRKAASK